MSLFDTPRRVLNPVLWNDKSLKPEVKKYIIGLVNQIFPEEKIADLIMIGSNVGHQYSHTSDIDVNVMGLPSESYDAWHKIFKHFNDKGHYYPGTEHQINFMFQEYMAPGDRDWSNSLGAYNILADTWEKLPIPFDKIGDPKVKYERELIYANMLLSQIESEVKLMNETRIQAPEEYQEAKKRLSILFKTIEDNRKTAYRYGTGTPALQEYNVIYKIVEGSQYGPLMHEMIHTFDEAHGG